MVFIDNLSDHIDLFCLHHKRMFGYKLQKRSCVYVFEDVCMVCFELLQHCTDYIELKNQLYILQKQSICLVTLFLATYFFGITSSFDSDTIFFKTFGGIERQYKIARKYLSLVGFLLATDGFDRLSDSFDIIFCYYNSLWAFTIECKASFKLGYGEIRELDCVNFSTSTYVVFCTSFVYMKT